MARRQTAARETGDKTTKVHLVERAYALPPSTKAAVREAREATGQTTRSWLAAAATESLPSLVAELQQLGFAKEEEARTAARWPWDPEALDALRDAAETTGLPQTTLLDLLVRRHANATPKRKTRRKGA